MQALQQAIAARVRPVLAAHGGDIEIVNITTDGFVKVRLTGACANCPGARQTIAEVVEAACKEACPEIEGVIPVHQVSDGLIQEALRLLRHDKT
ncbi:NifU family protein [Sporomusa termitida]|uniref:Fe/S biogenesis protein NfuA n=1 Tax=Sporomusa termitida TaxID=2377 RepID=A0A517DNR6_9FIRM|nr:NifU family protein [Sporomusa termitida]QDR79009.1 Fe/S biogenesis protein NfuA [Sporomusa termitida]